MIQYERYKGNNIICLCRNEQDKFPFSFGLVKAKLILDHIDEIREFVKKEEDNDSNRRLCEICG